MKMGIDIDYKRGILFIRLLGNLTLNNIFKFEEEVIPIVLELTARNVSINLANVNLIDNSFINSFIVHTNVISKSMHCKVAAQGHRLM